LVKETTVAKEKRNKRDKKGTISSKTTLKGK
jgi:hypothetical protein